jgi:hypothetical protein
MWTRALALVEEASLLLHSSALPPGAPDTVHVSATTIAFTMSGGLTGEDTRVAPDPEESR